MRISSATVFLLLSTAWGCDEVTSPTAPSPTPPPPAADGGGGSLPVPVCGEAPEWYATGFAFTGCITLDGVPLTSVTVGISSTQDCYGPFLSFPCVFQYGTIGGLDYWLYPERPASWKSSGFCGSGTISFSLQLPDGGYRSSGSFPWSGCGLHIVNYDFPPLADSISAGSTGPS